MREHNAGLVSASLNTSRYTPQREVHTAQRGWMTLLRNHQENLDKELEHAGGNTFAVRTGPTGWQHIRRNTASGWA